MQDNCEPLETETGVIIRKREEFLMADYDDDADKKEQSEEQAKEERTEEYNR